MILLKWLFGKKVAHERISVSSEEIEKVIIPFHKKNNATDYSMELDSVRDYFGKLYKSSISDFFKYNILHVTVPIGVYYGYTKYTGKTNRNGVRAVALYLPDNSLLVSIDRRDWKKYENELNSDNLKWLGYSDGESVRIMIFKNKASESVVTNFLHNCGEWISDVIYSNQIFKLAESLKLVN